MRDLTQGSIRGHLLQMSLFLGTGMVVQTLYYLVDLYFVARLGEQAVAGVSAAGNAMFIVLALTQTLGVSAVALISQAVGRKDRDDANLVFNQSLLLSLICAVITLAAGYLGAGAYMRSMAADEGTVVAGTTYLHWFVPGLALQFAMVAMGSALRGTGIVRPTMIVQVFTLVLNIALAPVLIAGWGTNHPLGVVGAALASTLSIGAGTLLLVVYFATLERYVSLQRDQFAPRLSTWKRILNVGLPAGGEFLQMFLITWVVYFCIRGFGPMAQAGYGVGVRVLQAMFLPTIAVAFAASPIAGQNFGAGNAARVRETFRAAVVTVSLMMAALTLLCQWRPELLIERLYADPNVVHVGAVYLRVTSWAFVGIGIVTTCSGIFQALGNTWPALVSSVGRMLMFSVPAIYVSTRPGVRIEYFWYISVTTVALQTIASLWLLREEFRKRLSFAAPQPHSVATETA
jgi:putative MATE family efflux protein